MISALGTDKRVLLIHLSECFSEQKQLNRNFSPFAAIWRTQRNSGSHTASHCDTLRFTRWSRRRCCPGKNTQFVGRARLGLERPSPRLTSPPWPWAWESAAEDNASKRASRLFHRGEGRRYLCCYLSHSLLQPQPKCERANARPAENYDELTRSSQAPKNVKSGLCRRITHYFYCFPLSLSVAVGAQNLITKYLNVSSKVSLGVSLWQESFWNS